MIEIPAFVLALLFAQLTVPFVMRHFGIIGGCVMSMMLVGCLQLIIYLTPTPAYAPNAIRMITDFPWMWVQGAMFLTIAISLYGRWADKKREAAQSATRTVS